MTKISVDSCLLQMETTAREILTDKTINPVFQRAHNVRGWVDARAYEIKHEMAMVSALCSLHAFNIPNPLCRLLYLLCSILLEEKHVSAL